MFIAPMLVETLPEPFSDSGWIFEPKLDGHRLLMSRKSGETRLWTGNGVECTRQYPELHAPAFDGEFILDGEVVCHDPETGAADGELTKERLHLLKKRKIESYAKQRPAHFIVWDILFHNGRDLRQLPLMKRRSILESVVGDSSDITVVQQMDERGEELWEYAIANRMEGIVGKRKDSKYVSKRSHDWLKVTNYQYADVYLAGYRKDKFGWVTHIEENGELSPAGIIVQDVPAVQQQMFRSLAANSQTHEDQSFVYLEPKVKARVKFTGRTRGGMLRSPEFVQFLL